MAYRRRAQWNAASNIKSWKKYIFDANLSSAAKILNKEDDVAKGGLQAISQINLWYEGCFLWRLDIGRSCIWRKLSFKDSNRCRDKHWRN